MKQISIQLPDADQKTIERLAGIWGMPAQRHNTPVVSRALTLALNIEIARRTLTDSEFIGFLAELYRPLTTE